MDKKFQKIRNDFPILNQKVNGEPLVYLDNAATSQKPQVVIDEMVRFYQNDNANTHRSVHTLGERATEEYEAARVKVQKFINAASSREIVFTKGTTDGLNLVASTYGENNVVAGDEIVVSYMEHHSNLIPWQQLALRKHATLKYIELTADGQLDLNDANQKITNKTKIVALTQTSNVLGVTNDIKQLAIMAHDHNAVIVADGAQAVPHQPVDVQALDADFYAFSGHKMLGPMGIGVLYGKSNLLKSMPPYQFGGEMIDFVEKYQSSWADIPWKFEAGTQNVAGAIGLGKAIDYLKDIGMQNIADYENQLVDYALPKLLAIPGLTVYGPQDPQYRNGVISFNLTGLHPHDLATALDMDGIAVRAGHHCAQPLMKYLDVVATARASFYLYNNQADIDQLIRAIYETKEFFRL
ncbi:cysteine desulfurase [Companilactobacillus zhachilii]|uniref:cysteine desulfurase n=1 Tax=Companilactobacillus zhachilii TaxID=2304606 RepID=A0A386PQ34_9LACO|nr:cysteine desulfurase [Companilactobacillus zhachilii]AYE37228.1 cysteine desulfurase [Companilactobacillus zhachilii]